MTCRNTSDLPGVGVFDSTIGRSAASLEPLNRPEAGEIGEDVLEIVHRQAGGESGESGEDLQEFVWDGSMEAGLIDAIDAEESGSTTEPHVHGPDCGHSRQEDPSPDMAELESNLIEVAHALVERYGDAGPTPEQEMEFMRDWLLSKGRSQEEIDAILTE